MRLVTWNIQHARRMDTGRPDVEAFAADVAGLAADVLALQEVDRRTRRLGGADLLAIAAEASGLTPIAGHVRRRPGGGTYGNALLVRGEPADVRGLALPRPWWPPWHRPEPRGALRCRVGGLTVATCHLGFDRPGEGASQLAAVFAWLDAAAGPAVLLGDLNLRRPHVAPGWRFLDVPRAFPADRPDRTIDHVAVRGLDATVVRDAKRPVVGDHRPVVVEIGQNRG